MTFKVVMFDFIGIREGESLEKFHDRMVNPDTEYIRQCGMTIDGISTLLKSRNFDYKVMRTIKGGSVGKGTALRGLSDVDLIFPIYDIKKVEDLKLQMKTIMDEIEKTLVWSEYRCKVKSKGTWAITFEIIINGKEQDVDIMPIANIAEDPSNLSKEEIQAIHDKMKRADSDTRNYYNRCLRPLQMEFIGQQLPKIKRAIRLMKYWVKTTEQSLIKSVAVELLVIRAWEDLGKPHPSVSEESICKAVFSMLRNVAGIKIYWTEYYKPSEFNIPPAPYILDPVDPYNNVITYITNHYNQRTPGVMQEIATLQNDADRAYKTFK